MPRWLGNYLGLKLSFKSTVCFFRSFALRLEGLSLLRKSVAFAGGDVNIRLLGVDLSGPWLQLLLLFLNLVVENLRFVYMTS